MVLEHFSMNIDLFHSVISVIMYIAMLLFCFFLMFQFFFNWQKTHTFYSEISNFAN